MRKQRNVDTEPVFGHIKYNRHFRRFLLCGLEGVSTEAGLLAIAHNMIKWWTKIQNQGSSMPAPPGLPANAVQIGKKSSQMGLKIELMRA